MITEARRFRKPILVVLAVILVGIAAIGALVAVKSTRPDAGRFDQCVSRDANGGDLLSNAAKRDVARMFVSTAENSDLRWQRQFGALHYNVEQNEAENRGYTGGIIGFTSRTASMHELVRRYVEARPQDNPLAPFLPALEAVNGTSSKEGLGPEFEAAWQQAADDKEFQQAQTDLADEWYLVPAAQMAAQDGLGALGELAYYDATVQHGSMAIQQIRDEAAKTAEPPSQGGDESTWLQAFFTAREAYSGTQKGIANTTRIDAQRTLLEAGNLGLDVPMSWEVHKDHYQLRVDSLGCRLGL